MCLGMRPDYVRIGLQYPNFKMIWFPSFTSYGFWRSAGLPDHEGVRLCSEDGKGCRSQIWIPPRRVGTGFGFRVTNSLRRRDLPITMNRGF